MKSENIIGSKQNFLLFGPHSDLLTALLKFEIRSTFSFFWLSLLVHSGSLARIAQPAGLHYNHCVSPSVRLQLANMIISLEPREIF